MATTAHTLFNHLYCNASADFTVLFNRRRVFTFFGPLYPSQRKGRSRKEILFPKRKLQNFLPTKKKISSRIQKSFFKKWRENPLLPGCRRGFHLELLALLTMVKHRSTFSVIAVLKFCFGGIVLRRFSDSPGGKHGIKHSVL